MAEPQVTQDHLVEERGQARIAQPDLARVGVELETERDKLRLGGQHDGVGDEAGLFGDADCRTAFCVTGNEFIARGVLGGTEEDYLSFIILLAGWGLGATGLAVFTFRWE